MKLNFKVIVVSLLAGSLVWISDALLDHVFFSQKDFWDLLLTDVPQHKLFLRILIILYFLIFGSVISLYVKRNKESAEELEEYEFKYKTIANKTNNWEFWRNVSGSYNYVSPAFEKITGYLVEDILENPERINKIIHPDDLLRVSKHFEDEIKNTLEISELEFRIVTQNNEVKRIKHKCEPVYDKDGKFMGCRGSNIEVVKYNLVSEQLFFDEALLKVQAESTVDGVLAVDEKGKIVLLNDQFKKLWDLPADFSVTADEEKLMETVLSKLKNPKALISRLEYLYDHPDDKTKDSFTLQNGIEVEAISSPIKDSKGKYYGRVWNFRSEVISGKLSENKKEQNHLADHLFDSICQPLYVINAQDYTVESCNKAAGDNFSTEGQKCYKLSHGKDEPCSNGEHPCPIKLVKESKAPVVVHHKHYDKSGNLHLVEVHGYPVFDDDGNVEKIIEHSIDITDYIQAKDQLKSVEDKFEALFENAPDAFFIHDLKGTLINGNNAAWRLTGYKKEEMIGQNFLRSKLMSINDALNAARLFAENKKGKPAGPHEFFIFRKDSSRVPVEIRSFPVSIKNDYLVIFSIVRDISERKFAEQKATETESRFRGLFENSTLGIYRSNTKGKIVTANPAAIALLGFDSLDDLLKINVPDHYVEESETRERFIKIIENEGVIHDFEFQWKKPNGAIVHLKESARAILNKKGRIEFYEGIFEDVTEKKRAEAALIKAKDDAEELSRLKSNFLANVSHELRTPLTGITGFAEILGNELTNNELKQMAQSILVSSERLSHTLDLILDLSLLETKNLKINYQDVNIVEIVESLIHSYKEKAVKSGIDLNFIGGEKKLMCNLDKNLFIRAFSNILDNGLKFTSNGEIEVRISHNGSAKAILQITDNGIGIPEDKLEQIFEPFRQVSEGNGRLYEGTGLGLTLAKKFIEVSGGNLSVVSNKNKGTTFTIELSCVN